MEQIKQIVHDWWIQFTVLIGVIWGVVSKEKVLNLIKSFIQKIIPDHFKALELHETKDDERFKSLNEKLDFTSKINDSRHDELIARMEKIADNMVETVNNNTSMLLNGQRKMDEKIDRNQENLFQMILTIKKG